jgi:NAD(P)H dehydrogenase (quinone)
MSSNFLREQVLPVRALVHRLDERSQVLSEMGAELVVADLTNGADVAGTLGGWKRMYFGMSLSRFIFKLRVFQQPQ